MKTTNQFALALVTAPNRRTARKLARAALQARLVACANLIPRLESHYWWQGKIEGSTEVLLLFKTAIARLPSLEQLILAEHPYDTPELIVLRLNAGTQRYLSWLRQSVDLKHADP